MPFVPIVPYVTYMEKEGTWNIRLFIRIFSNALYFLLEDGFLSFSRSYQDTFYYVK